jgi:WD40 repeat protein
MVLPIEEFADAGSTPTWSFYTGAEVRDVDVSDDGNYVAVGSYKNKLYLFHKDGTKLWEKGIPVSNDQWPRTTHSVQISGDGNYIAAGDDNGVLHLYNRAGTELWSRDMGTSKVYSVAISNDGSYIASSSGGDVNCFSRLSGTPLWNVVTDSVRNIEISDDGVWIAIGSLSADLYLYRNDIFAGTKIWEYGTEDNYVNIDMSADGQVVVVGEDDPGDDFGSNAYLFSSMRDGNPGWGPGDGTPVWIYQQPDDIYTVAVSRDGMFAVIGGTNSHFDPISGKNFPGGKTYLFETNSGIPLINWTTGTAASSDITSNGKYMVIGGYDRKVYLLDRDSLVPIWNYSTSGSVTSIAVSPYFTLETDQLPPPYLTTDSINDGKDLLLEWIGEGLGGYGTIVAGSEDDLAYVFVEVLPTIDHYLIYRSETQTGFDFDALWANTSIDVNPTTGIVDPLNDAWLDANVIDFGHAAYRDEYYYMVRAVYTNGTKSSTGNTAGYHVIEFGEGPNTFSLPLKPFGTIALDALMNDLGASSVSWLDSNDDWQTFPTNPVAPDAEIGKGYVLEFPFDLRYVFTGEPAAMIMYTDKHDWDFPENSLVTASLMGNDIRLAWSSLGPGIVYYVYYSNIRHGFFTGAYGILNLGSPLFGTTYIDSGTAGVTGEHYYMIVPVNLTTSETGSSTYSIGIISMEFNGNEMIGLPLKPQWGDKSADWYVERIFNSLGIVYLDGGIWKAHFKEFPEGVYDTILERGRGYEVTTFATSRFSFIGF